ncbi:hypothetical protein [Caldalkalibacillus salinus]|uniref:hypothetical protein n=1 Tax=Caldalkalibacillus salinus TaxID=2803787 RepID=UPI001924E631|nr:hypothetical protein [Caldalkalibacillus salinus]
MKDSQLEPLERLLSSSPKERLEGIRYWYKQVSPYVFKWFDIFGKLSFVRDYYFGMDVELFSRWEYDTNRVSDRLGHGTKAKYNYWAYVNRHFCRDLYQAAVLQARDAHSDESRVQYLIDYLNAGKAWRDREGQTPLLKRWRTKWRHRYNEHIHHMLALFWRSHNTSIVYWDWQARVQDYYNAEDPVEQRFINGVIIRLDFVSDLPFHLPHHRNMMLPIGLIGEFLNHGPLKYPQAYPAPEPRDMLNDEQGLTAALLQHYFHFFTHRRFSAVFTWWIPTPADKLYHHMMAKHQLTIDSPQPRWIREWVQPAQKTIEEIEQRYLNTDDHRIQGARTNI